MSDLIAAHWGAVAATLRRLDKVSLKGRLSAHCSIDRLAPVCDRARRTPRGGSALIHQAATTRPIFKRMNPPSLKRLQHEKARLHPRHRCGAPDDAAACRRYRSCPGEVSRSL